MVDGGVQPVRTCDSVGPAEVALDTSIDAKPNLKLELELEFELECEGLCEPLTMSPASTHFLVVSGLARSAITHGLLVDITGLGPDESLSFSSGDVSISSRMSIDMPRSVMGVITALPSAADGREAQPELVV
jgi:hypothetical protein